MSSRVLTVEIVGNAGQLERALGRAAAASKSFGSQMESVGQKMAGVGRTLTTHVTLPILAIAAASTKMALDFESSMQLIRTQGGATQTEVNKMSKAVLDLVAHQRSYGYSANDMAGALRDIEFEGFQGARALEILRAGAAGARLGNADLKTVMDALTGAMVAFHVPAAKAAQLMATLSATVGQGRMTIGDLSAAMSSKLMPAASALNITVSQMGAALDIFTSKNVPAAAAANNLTTAFIKMATPSKAAVAIAKEMGFSFDQVKATLQTGGLPDALGVLANAYQNMVRKVGQVNAGADLMAAFGGSRTGASVASLVESYSDYMRRLKNIQAQVDVGKFWREASAAMGLPANKIKSAVQSIGAAMIQLGQVLAPVVAGLAQFLAGLAARFDKLSPSTKRFIEIAAGIAAALGPTLMIVGRFTQAIGMLSNAMMFLATNPEMLLVAAFAAIAGAVVAAEYAPKQFTAILEKLGVSAGTAKRVIADLQEAFRVFRKIVEIAMKGLIPVLKDAFNTLKANFQLFADLLRGKWGNLWGDLKRVAVADFHQMADGVISTLKALLGLAERAAQAIGDGILHHILDPIKNLAVELWHWLENEISSAISTVVGWVKAKAEAIGHAITSGIMSGLGGLSNIAGGIFHTLGGGIMSGLGSVGSFLGIGSPSRWTHDHIGRPIGQGIVEGAKSGLANLGAALQGSINAAMRAGGAAVARNRLSFMQEWKQLTQAAVQSIRGGTPAVTAAMRNLENAAMTAFDAATQAGTQRIKQNLTRQLDQIQSILASRIAFVQSYYQQQINAVMAPSNALEKQIQQQQQAHDLAAAQYNLAQAKQQLQSDQAAGADQQTLDADQRAIDEAQYQLTQLQEQIQLENERAAAAQKVAAIKKKESEEEKQLKAQARDDTKAAREKASAEEEWWRQTRKDERKGLQAYLADLRTGLGEVAKEWKLHHDTMMKLFHGKYKKDFGDAGTALADAFNSSVKAGMRELERFLEQLGIAIGSYLKPAGAVPGAAEGGIFNAVPGGMYRFVEAGYPEAVIPLDPSKRAQATSLVGQVATRLNVPRFAGGGVAHYVPGTVSALEQSIQSTWPNTFTFHEELGSAMKLVGLLHRYPGALNPAGGFFQQNAVLHFMRYGPGQSHPHSPLFNDTGGAIGVVGYDGGSYNAYQDAGWPTARHMAAGGIIRARAGGTLARIGEAGRDEAVIPLPPAGQATGGGGVHLHIDSLHISGDLSDPNQRRQTARLLLDEMHSELRRRSQRTNGLGLK